MCTLRSDLKFSTAAPWHRTPNTTQPSRSPSLMGRAPSKTWCRSASGHPAPGWVPSCGMPGCGDDAKVSSLKMLEGHHCANPIASQVSGGVLVGSLFGQETPNPNKCTPFWEKFKTDDLRSQELLGYFLKTHRIWTWGAAPSSNPMSFQEVPQ